MNSCRHHLHLVSFLSQSIISQLRSFCFLFFGRKAIFSRFLKTSIASQTWRWHLVCVLTATFNYSLILVFNLSFQDAFTDLPDPNSELLLFAHGGAETKNPSKNLRQEAESEDTHFSIVFRFLLKTVWKNYWDCGVLNGLWSGHSGPEVTGEQPSETKQRVSVLTMS